MGVRVPDAVGMAEREVINFSLELVLIKWSGIHFPLNPRYSVSNCWFI